MSTSSKRRWLQRRWDVDPCCRWCGQVTVLGWSQQPHVSPPRNLATVDHLRDRFHPRRQEPAQNETRRVLACWECNFERGRERVAAQPKEELWRRSGSYPRDHPLAKNNVRWST